MHASDACTEKDIINRAKELIPTAKDTLKLALEEMKRKGINLQEKLNLWDLAEELIITTGKIFDEKLEEARKYGELELRKRGLGTRNLTKALSNLARQHGGETIEEIFAFILNMYNIPFERKVNVGTKDFPAEADFVIPGLQMFNYNKKCTILISVKRKVRERWKLTLGDAYILRAVHGYPDNIWFVTLAKRNEVDIPAKAVKIFTRLEIRVYVPDPVFDRFSRYDSSERRDRARKFSSIIDDIRESLQECSDSLLNFLK